MYFIRGIAWYVSTNGRIGGYTKKNEASETKGVSGVRRVNEPCELDSIRGDVRESIISYKIG